MSLQCIEPANVCTLHENATGGGHKELFSISRVQLIDLKLQPKGTATKYKSATIMLESYSDADNATNCTHRKSVTGGVVCLNRMIFGWMCRKQVSVSLSTMEAAFVPASMVATGLLVLMELLGEIGVHVVKPMVMHVDNQSAIRQIQREYSVGRGEHIAA